MIWLTLLALAQAPLTIHVDVTGLSSSRGVVECVLWNAADGFPRDTSHGKTKTSVTVLEGRATCVFDGIEPGTYAVTLMHDENSNGVMDTNFLGIPIEHYGFSNNPRPFLRAPTFKEAAFIVSDAPVKLNVKVL